MLLFHVGSLVSLAPCRLTGRRPPFFLPLPPMAGLVVKPVLLPFAVARVPEPLAALVTKVLGPPLELVVAARAWLARGDCWVPIWTGAPGAGLQAGAALVPPSLLPLPWLRLPLAVARQLPAAVAE